MENDDFQSDYILIKYKDPSDNIKHKYKFDLGSMTYTEATHKWLHFLSEVYGYTITLDQIKR